MIVVEIQLWSALTGERKVIGRTAIDNVGVNEDGKRADYRVRVGRRDKLEMHEVLGSPIREGRVKNFPRVSYNVWRLVIRALLATFREERS